MAGSAALLSQLHPIASRVSLAQTQRHGDGLLDQMTRGDGGLLDHDPVNDLTVDECGTRLRKFRADPQVAVSLKKLSEKIASGQPLSFAGMTRLDGFMSDIKDNDVLLWGIKEQGLPELHVQDFVVALRAAHGEYDEIINGRRLRKSPAISLDPEPHYWDRYLKKQKYATPANRKNWLKLCRRYPQKTRVEGMPFDTRLAKVLIDADYRMKEVAQGHRIIPTAPPFHGDFDIVIARAKAALKQGKKSPFGSKKTRYWFEPGKFNYVADSEAEIVSNGGDTAFLETAQVVLRDEAQRSVNGRGVASGKIDPVVREFTCAWTRHMDETYEAEFIWRDMHNVFRHFAVANILAERNALRRARFDSSELLKHMRIPHTPVPKTYPGLGRVAKIGKTKSGRRRWTTWYRSVCGGVSLEMSMSLKKQGGFQNTPSIRSLVASAVSH